MAMATHHPVHALRSALETARLKAIEELAAKGGISSSDALRELAALQIALTAVREEIKAHGARLGWGAGNELD
jgi:phosphoribosylformylglycinamidine (FGAM) synthase-like amidotransferase family enzyme